MSDLISRKKLKAIIEPMVGKFEDDGSFWWSRDSILSAINSELVEAEPKVGKWIEKDGMWCDDPTFRCSVCGEEYELLEGTPIDNGMNYCPNCGSRMFERRADE